MSARDKYMSEVEVLGWFGRDQSGGYVQDPSVVQYLNLPESLSINDMPTNFKLKQPFDLNVRHPSIRDQYRENGTTFDHIFQWIKTNSRDDKNKPCGPKVDIVCKKSNLKTLLLAPLSAKTDYVLHAVKLKGVVYFQLHWLSDFGMSSSGQWTWRRPKNPPQTDAPTRHGTKFEHYLLADEPNGKPDPTRPILRYDDMSCVYQTTLAGRHTLMYAGEVDGVSNKSDLANLSATHFVELKTIADELRILQQPFIKKLKLSQWWAQCVLAKTDTILLGFRDRAGLVKRLERLDVHELPRRAEYLWNPETFFNFLDSILDKLKNGLIVENKKRGFLWRRGSTSLEPFHCPDLVQTEVVPRWYSDWLHATSAPNKRSARQDSSADLVQTEVVPSWYSDWLDASLSNKRSARRHRHRARRNSSAESANAIRGRSRSQAHRD